MSYFYSIKRNKARHLVMLCVLFFIFIAKQGICHNLLCKNWLGGEFIGRANGDGNGGREKDSTKDKWGIKGQCSDFFPAFMERMRIERLGEDPFDVQYRVATQHCWWRNILDSKFRCGMPRWWCIGCNKWDPPSSTQWGATINKSVSGGQLENSCVTVTLVKLFNKAKLCLFQPKTEYLHGGLNNTKRGKVCAYYEPWLLSGIVGHDEYSKNLIGCVDIPLNPIPNVFNPTIPSGVAPYVDNLGIHELINQYNSKFDQPVIVMQYKTFDVNSDTQIDETLVLRYRFDGDDYIYPSSNTAFANAPKCGSFSAYPAEYCAIIPPDMPDKICICESNKCSQSGIAPDCVPDEDNACTCDPNNCLGANLGCVSRPTPRDSKVSIVGEFISDKDASGAYEDKYPAISLIFTRTDGNDKPIKIDADGSQLYEVNGEFFKLGSNGEQTGQPAKPPIDFLRLPLSDKSKPPVTIKEYFLDQNAGIIDRGSASIYGIDFESIIPIIDSSGKMVKINGIIPVNPQYNLMSSANEAEGAVCEPCGCAVCSKFVDGEADEVIKYGGQRDNSLCCPIDSITESIKDEDISLQDALNERCIVPPYEDKCAGYRLGDPPYKYKDKTAPLRDEEMEKLICPGLYQGVSETDAGDGSQICSISKSSWEAASLDKSLEPYCVKIPGCGAITNPSDESGNAIWGGDDMQPGGSQTGSCSGGDFTAQIKVTVLCSVCDDPSSPPADKAEAEDQRQQAIQIVEREEQEAEQGNKKININKINSEIAAFNYISLKIDTMEPIRKCLWDNQYKVDNPCVHDVP